MGVRQTGTTQNTVAPSLGGIKNNDAGSAFRTLHGKGGAIAYDANSYSLVGIDHEVQLTSRHADGSARTWQQTARDGVYWLGQKLFGGARPPAPKAGQLVQLDHRGQLLGRKDQNPRNLSRLQQLSIRQVPNSNGSNSQQANSSQNPQSSQQIAGTANNHLNNLAQSITNYFNNEINTFAQNRTEISNRQDTINNSFWKRNVYAGEDGRVRQQRQDANQAISNDIDRNGTDALNRLNNLETTLKAHNQNQQLTQQQQTTLHQGRKKVLRSMIETRLPGLQNQDGPAQVGNALQNVVQNGHQNYQPLAPLVQNLNNANTPQAKQAAIAAIEDKLHELHRNGLLDTESLKVLKHDLDDIAHEAGVDVMIDQLVKLEEENGQDPDYQKYRTALLNHMTSFGHTRDWAASNDADKRRQAAESMRTLASSLRDSENVDMLIGGDKRLDGLAETLKLKAARREVDADDSIPQNSKDQVYGQREALIKAQHKLNIAQRTLAAHLEVDKTRLFAGSSMGGVRMDAQFFDAVRNTKGGKDNAQNVNLLTANVRRLQDDVDRLKKQAEPNAPLTQAEASLMRHTNDRIATIDRELQRVTNDRDQLQQTEEPHPQHVTNSIQAANNKIANLTNERQQLVQRRNAGPTNVNTPPSRTTLGNFERQVAAERERNTRAKQELGTFADYGIDKKVANQVFGDKGGLKRTNGNGGSINQGVLRDTKRDLSLEADPKKVDPQLDREEKQLVEQSIDALIKNKMRSTNDVLKAQKDIQDVAGSMFAKKSNIMALQLEVSSDFSPEVQANEFTRAVLQTYADDQTASVTKDHVGIQTRVRQLGQSLTEEQNEVTAQLQRLNQNKRQLESYRNTLILNIQTAIQERNQLQEKESNLKKDETLSKEERQKLDQLPQTINQQTNEKDYFNTLIQNVERDIETRKTQSLFHQVNEANNNEHNAVQLLGQENPNALQLTQCEVKFSNILDRRRELLDQQASQSNRQNQPAPMDHKDLQAVLRAAVLSARPKGTRLDEYNPVDHQNDIENTLTQWGLQPDLVRPELTDIMTTSLDKKEIERWQSDFKDRDQSRGAGSKLYTGGGKASKRLFQGALRADISKRAVDQRIDHQVRHMNAQIDELTPGSKLRIDYQAGRSGKVEAMAKFHVIEAEADMSFEHNANDEIEIRCSSDKYDLQMKPGYSNKLAVNAGISVQTPFAKFLSAGLSGGINLQGVRFDGSILSFKHDGTEQGRAEAKQRMQTMLEHMAKGDEIPVDTWNSLADDTQMVFEKQNQGGINLEAGIKADGTGDLLGSEIDLEASLGANATTYGRTKEHVIVNGDTTTLKREKKYSYQIEVAADASAQITFGKMPDDEDNNLGSVTSSNKVAKGLENATNDLGKANYQYGNDHNNIGLNAGLNVGGGIGASTTWERRAYAKSQVAMDSSTGMIKKAELDFQSTMNGHVMDSDTKRQKAANDLLKRLATWSGHSDKLNSVLQDNDNNPTALQTQLNDLFRQTSGTDYLVLKLELDKSKMDEANEYLAQANQLEDPTRGQVTTETSKEAAELRGKAQKILDDRSNYVPKKVNLIPTQNDEISRKGDYIPFVSDMVTKPVVGDAIGVALAFSNPAISFAASPGHGMAPISGKITSKMSEKSKLKQEFGHEHSLGYRAPTQQSQFHGYGNTAVPRSSQPSSMTNQSSSLQDNTQPQPNSENIASIETTGEQQSSNGTHSMGSNSSNGPTNSPPSNSPTSNSNQLQGLVQNNDIAPQRANFADKNNLLILSAQVGNTDNVQHDGLFYKENQDRASCAVHSANVLFGGPKIDVNSFTNWKMANNLGHQNDTVNRNAVDARNGSYPHELVNYVNYLHDQNLVDTRFRQDVVSTQNNAVLPPINGDHCIIGYDRPSAHYVAFRKDNNDNWYKIDSNGAKNSSGLGVATEVQMTPQAFVQQLRQYNDQAISLIQPTN